MEKQILKTFLYNEKLKFNEIEKRLKTRSNKLAYHLKNLTKKNILTKEGEMYSLSKSSEHLIPYLSEKTSPLVVLLVHIGNEKKCFLHKRKKRPFLNKLSLPGGRLLTGESIESGVKRIAKEKFKVEVEFKKINSISLEHVEKEDPNTSVWVMPEGAKLHSFLLIFTSATTKDKIKLTSIKSNKKNIISSDYELLTNDLNKKTEIKTLLTKA